MSGVVQFWFEFASSYSYLSAMRIEAEAEKREVAIEWKPFLLGPIFASQGWNTSPFKIYQTKGRYMWRDLERRSQQFGLEFNRPESDESFPQNGLSAARIALVGLQSDWGPKFVKEVYKAQWVEGHTISETEVLSDCIASSGGDVEEALIRSQNDSIKNALRANSDEAISRGLFGAPSFTIADELFWGDDRLENALDWCSSSV